MTYISPLQAKNMNSGNVQNTSRKVAQNTSEGATAFREKLANKAASDGENVNEGHQSKNSSHDDKEKGQQERSALPSETSLFSLRNRLDTKAMSAQQVKADAQNSHAVAAAARQDSMDLLQELSSRILVSTPRADGSKEVHIQIKNDLLPQTEARLQLNGNQLQVNLVCSDISTANFLSQHADSLQNTLAQKSSKEVAVTVTDSASGQTGQRGGQGDGDGRSRQQRNIYDEMED